MGKNNDTNQQEKSASLDNIDVNDAQIDQPKQSDDLSKKNTPKAEDGIPKDNTPKKNTKKNTVQKSAKKKLANIMIVIIMPLILMAGLLIFAYKNNLVGFKDFTNELRGQSFIPQENNIKKDTLNATQQVAQEKKSNIQNNIIPKVVHQAQDGAVKASDNHNKNLEPLPVQDQDTVQNTVQNTVQKKDMTPQQEDVLRSTKVPFIENTHQDSGDNNEKMTQVKQASDMFLSLVNKVNEGSSYLDILIDLKTKIKNTDVEIPTLTEYASAGFPTNTIIIAGALKVLNKLVVLQSRQEAQNMFDKILNKFIIVTPTSKINGFSGTLFDIKKSLQNDDFEAALEKIDELTAQQQKSFNDLKLILKDKKNIQHELKLFNDALISDIFI